MNNKYDKIEKNLPIKYTEIDKLWIYEGNNEMEYTPFAGKYLNRAGKGIFLNLIYLQKIIQINKSIFSALEGNYELYDSTKIYSEGDVVLDNNIFYISLDDNNNKALSDTKLWYPFKMNLPFLIMKDEKTNEKYKLTINNGELKINKVE